ncbi:molybdenum cofactor biosynthesis protein MoaE [Ornithinimicrobium sp. Arc0846-15]|nr:molybdenum cofactor biosynthesis protein MoaE [Ornithinimicrobium laminariae]
MSGGGKELFSLLSDDVWVTEQQTPGPDPTAQAPNTWGDVLDTPLSVDAAIAAVQHQRAGAVVTFIGTVRDHDGGRDGVTELSYSAHPDAVTPLRAIVKRIAANPGVCGVAAVHRKGALQVGDLAVVCAVSAEHRPEAFAGARELIEELKATVPIWKNQEFDGSDREWVGL